MFALNSSEPKDNFVAFFYAINFDMTRAPTSKRAPYFRYLQHPCWLVTDDILDLAKTCEETALFHPAENTQFKQAFTAKSLKILFFPGGRLEVINS